MKRVLRRSSQQTSSILHHTSKTINSQDTHESCRNPTGDEIEEAIKHLIFENKKNINNGLLFDIWTSESIHLFLPLLFKKIMKRIELDIEEGTSRF